MAVNIILALVWEKSGTSIKVWAQGMEGWRLLHQVMTPVKLVIIIITIIILIRCLSSRGPFLPLIGTVVNPKSEM